MYKAAISLLAALLAAAGCGGGGLETPPGGGAPPQTVPQQSTVVQLDHDGDGELDLLTLDTSRTPYVIYEAIYGGSAGGDPVEMTDVLRGTELDIDVSNALASYQAGSFNVGARTELDVADSAGHPVRVVVFE